MKVLYLFGTLCAVSTALYVKPRITDEQTAFYEMCGKEGSKCLGAPAGADGSCIELQTCTRAVGVEQTADGQIFHMITNEGAQYIALGFSKDTKMGEDPVVGCIVEDDSTVTAHLSYNDGHSSVASDTDTGLSNVVGTNVDSVVYCKFTLEDVLGYARHGDETNSDTDFYIVAATGSVSNGGLGHHGGNTMVSDDKWTLKNVPDTPAAPIYDICKKEGVQCVGAYDRTENENNSCMETGNCTRTVAMETVADGGFIFHLYATGDIEYVAVGFSDDVNMGGEPCVSCVRSETGQIQGQISFNNGYKNERASSDSDVDMLESSSDGTSIYCKFNLTDTLTFAQHFTNNTDQEFYILGVAGKLQGDGSLGSHGRSHAVSPDKWKLKSGAGAAVASVLLAVAAALAVFHV